MQKVLNLAVKSLHSSFLIDQFLDTFDVACAIDYCVVLYTCVIFSVSHGQHHPHQCQCELWSTGLPRTAPGAKDGTFIPVAVRTAHFRCCALPTIRKALVVCEFVVANEATPGDIRATLHFPLPSDAVVSGCRFEVGKALVPAVTVSKKRAAAVAYVEEEPGRHVGSTSAVQGNMWQMDIFPLPRGRPRRLKVSFTCPLREASAGLELRIPMSFETPLRKVTVQTHTQPQGVQVSDSLGGRVTNTLLSEGVCITMADSRSREPSVLSCLYLDRLHFAVFIPDDALAVMAAGQAGPVSAKPQGSVLVGLVWDVSRSCAGLCGPQTKAFLQALARHYQTQGTAVAFRLTTFSTTAARRLEQGTLADLLEALKGLEYEEGTDLTVLEKALADRAVTYSLLFTDRVDNQSGQRSPHFAPDSPPTHVAIPPAESCGVAGVNAQFLRRVAYQTGGTAMAPDGAFAAVLAGVRPRRVLRQVECLDLRRDPELLLDEDLETVPNCKLSANAWPVAAEGVPQGVTDFQVRFTHGRQDGAVAIRVPPSLPLAPEFAQLVGVQHCLQLAEHVVLAVANSESAKA